jgi:hypothetical protein
LFKFFLKTSRLEISKEDNVSVFVHRPVKTNVPVQMFRPQESLLLSAFVLFTPPVDWMVPAQLGRTIYFPSSTKSALTLIQKCLTDTLRIMLDEKKICLSVKLALNTFKCSLHYFYVHIVVKPIYRTFSSCMIETLYLLYRNSPGSLSQPLATTILVFASMSLTISDT